MTETWLSVDGFEDYEVSNLGRVRSWRGCRGRRRSMPLILKPIRCGNYDAVTLCTGSVKRKRYVHHLVAEGFIGPRPDGQEIRHLNGDRYDCRATNLAYGTHRQNVRDMVQHGHGWWQNPEVMARRLVAWRKAMAA